MNRSERLSIFVVACIVCASLLASCKPGEPPARPWREELTIIVVQGNNNDETEFRQQLITLFARQLHVKVRLLPLPPERVVPALMTGRAHIAATGMRSNEAEGGLRFAPSYQSVSEQVVCGKPPRRLEGLGGRQIAVVTGSSQNAALLEAQHKFPQLQWETRNQQTVADLLAEVATGKLECTVTNEQQLAQAHSFYPQLEAAFDIAPPSKLAWAFAPDGDEALFAEAQKFFALIKQDGTLRRLLDRYYGHYDRVEPVDSVAFLDNVRTVLPRYRKLFEEAGMLTGIEWQLLAALAYHESHWNPLATSPTGVRGIMMLTEETADRMDVKDRLDPIQSIQAGARYLQLLKEQLPLRIPDEERSWLALAAYNQGMGHLEDARTLAAKNGLNPDSWPDVKQMMRMLSQPEYFEQTKHGYARGGEAVVLTETVHMYYDMLKHMDTGATPSLQETPFRLKLPVIGKFSMP